MKNKILFTSVFGPYGIKNKYAEGLAMQMELFNNQVTRFQGVHSIRKNYQSYPLYLLAENISIPSTVLDLPTWRDFKNELKKGYTHVAITFITLNVLKVKRMTEYIRKKYPEIQIILGGYGTVLPGLKDIVDYDEICHGEGVSWIREYFKENKEAPIKHPLYEGCGYIYIYGYKKKAVESPILVGIGCKNACEFCLTSHKFGERYIPLIKNADEFFKVCLSYEEKLGVNYFSVMDDNFLLNARWVKELLLKMENAKKTYFFNLFASIDKIAEYGVDFLCRLGVKNIFIGIESKKDVFNKTKNIDIPVFLKELQSKGITIIAASMLFLEHHDQKTIYEDIDWFISLSAGMIHFTIYTPYPGTWLHNRLKKEGRLLESINRCSTGANHPGFKHRYFKDPMDFERILEYAIKKNFEINGPSFLNSVNTIIRGYIRAKEDFEKRQREGMVWNHDKGKYEKTDMPAVDEFMKKRLEMMLKYAEKFRISLLSAKVFSPNLKAREKAKETINLYNEVYGDMSLKEKFISYYILLCACVEQLRIFLNKMLGRKEFIRKPPTVRKEY